MTTIYHLVVGNEDFTPTDTQLKEVVEEFQKPLPAFGVPVAVYEVFITPDNERLLLNVGTVDWQPSPRDIEALVALFQEAALSPNDGIVATRTGVTASVIPKLVI